MVDSLIQNGIVVTWYAAEDNYTPNPLGGNYVDKVMEIMEPYIASKTPPVFQLQVIQSKVDSKVMLSIEYMFDDPTGQVVKEIEKLDKEENNGS